MPTIANSIGTGSGIDTKQLITDLVKASRENSDKILTEKKEATAARISGLGQITSALNAFSTALTGLVSGGTLGSQAVTSDSSALGASFTGSALALDSTVEIRRLAASQTLSSAPVLDPTAPIGQGQLTISFGTVTSANGAATGFAPNAAAQSVTVTIGPENDSLQGLVQAINGAKAGVTASIIKDGTGSRLVLKGATGAAQGFTIAADPGLEAFEFGVGATGMSQAASAADAQIVLDGIMVERSSNTLTDLIPGVKLDLKRAEVGRTLSLTTTRDTGALTQAVGDYVAAYNEVQGLISELTANATGSSEAGALRGERAVRELQTQLKALTSKKLLDGEGPASLAEIGIKTNRDGTLAVDSQRLSAAIAASPARVESLFVASQASSSPLVGISSAVGKVKAGVYEVTDIVPGTSGVLSVPAASTAFDTPVVIDSTNNTLRLKVDGKQTLDIVIPDGSYATGAELAAALQTAINDDSVLSAFDLAVTASWTASGLELRSRSVGTRSVVDLVSVDSDLEARLGLGTSTSTAGSDAKGKIGGLAAQGFGNFLVASADSPAVGLMLAVQSGATTATIRMSGGISGAMADIYKLLATGDGVLASASARLTKEQEKISTDAAKVDARAAAYEQKLTMQFAAMEAAVEAFKSTQSFLDQQVEAWNSANR